MKLLFLEGDMSRRGGTERMTALLSSLLSPEHQVHIVSLNLADDGVFFPLGETVRHSVLSPANMAGKIAQIRRLLRSEKTDVVINVDTGMGVYGILAALGTKTKVITWEHANFCNNWCSRLFPHLRRLAARHSDAMVVLTETDRKNYLSGIRGCAPVTVIPNPAQPQPFTYDPTSKTILSVGLFSPVKGFDRIPELGKTVFARFPDWQWIVCGDGPEKEAVRQKIAGFGLEDRILMPGTVTDLASYYRGAAVYVMTSRMEGLPMVLLEAKSWGLPLISFDIMTGPSDIIRDGVNGCLVENGNLDAMAQTLMELMSSADLRRQFSEHSQLDMDKFSTESVVAAWQTLLSSL